MRRFVVLSFLVVLGSFSTALSPAVAQDTVLRPPVDADVLDPFRLPDGPFMAGNRGIEYDTTLGDPVRAAGPGMVVFAGAVAGATWITLDHGGGLRTSYGPLATIAVSAGDVVSRGDRIATTADALHFSARVDGVYVDPDPLFGELVIEVRLVPHGTDDTAAVIAAAEHGERLALFDLEQERRGEGGGLSAALGRWVGDVVGSLTPAELLGGLWHSVEILVAVGAELSPAALQSELINGLLAVVDPGPCTDATTAADAVAPPGRRIAVVIDGLGSASEEVGLRGDLGLDELGYRADDVVRFSYAGGLTPGGGANWDAAVPRTEYDPVASARPVARSVDALAETLRQVRAANPDAAIDVYGHSLGGVVARHALAEVQAEVDVSVAVTFASPHAGAPAATMLDAILNTTPGVVIGHGVDAVDPDSGLRLPAVGELSEAGFVGDTADLAFPDDVHAVTIGHRADLAVPGTEAGAPGAQHVIVGGFDPLGAHGDLAALPESRREVRLALAGLAPACTGVRDGIFDLVAGETIAGAYRAAAAAVATADLPTGVVGSRPR